MSVILLLVFAVELMVDLSIEAKLLFPVKLVILIIGTASFIVKLDAMVPLTENVKHSCHSNLVRSLAVGTKLFYSTAMIFKKLRCTLACFLYSHSFLVSFHSEST